MSSVQELFGSGLRVVNVGLPEFALPLQDKGVPVTTLDWRPPAQGDPSLGRALADLVGHPQIAAANTTAIGRLLDTRPMLVDVRPAEEVLPELAADRLLLHAGPPVDWEAMCGPMRAAVAGAALLEGWADTPEAAERLAAGGGIMFSPCHDHSAVGPMAGIISASMPVMVVEDAGSGRRAYSNLNEGQGRCLRYGALGEDVMSRLRWMQTRLGPSLSAALRSLAERIDLRSIIAQALQMGDECHSRNVAGSSLLTRQLAAALARQDALGGVEALEFLRDNNYWFLNFAMAASKLATAAAHGVPGSTVVTAMARNGTEFGIRVSGIGDRWFTAPSPVPEGLYFPGYSAADANPDIGDSAIAETNGLGGFALAGAPAIVGFVGGTPAEGQQITEDMGTITVARHREYQLPALDFAGAPVGIDVRAVVDSGLEPVITTGISHRRAGIGQIGAGITAAPMACFLAALAAFEVPADRPETG